MSGNALTGNAFDDLGGKGMAQPGVDKVRPSLSNGYGILQAQEPLPPYELDPHFLYDPEIYVRIGDLIARPTVLGRFSRQ
jgi:hypothetical protein